MNDRNAVLANIDGQSQLLIAALNTSISGVIITDCLQPDNPVIYCNKAFEEMTGYLQEEILGKNCRLLQGEDREQLGRYKIQEAIAQGMDCHVELANYRKDGTVFFNELYLGPVKNSLGTVTHYIGIQNDITLRRLKETSMQLELSNSKKLQQQKDEFTSVASHELKTPITSLKATLQLMNQIIGNEPPANDRLIQLSKNAERHTHKLTHLVDDLLSSTKIIKGELALNKSKFPLTDVIAGCCTHVSLNGKHRVKNIGDHAIEVFADQHKIDQVLINLVNNAVKYAPKSEEIEIAVERMQKQVKISVKDYGCGISENELPLVFSRYYQTGKEEIHISGLGLGLYISSEIIRRHGGEMGVESKPGKGSTFWFTIPEND